MINTLLFSFSLYTSIPTLNCDKAYIEVYISLTTIKMNTLNVDWTTAHEKGWEFTGADIMYQKSLEELCNCSHGNHNQSYCHECELYPDQAYSDNLPMYNKAYQLKYYNDDLEEEKIIKICNETACTVVYHQDYGNCLALAGAGMDFSQSIAHAYMIAYALPKEDLGCIDWNMLDDVTICSPLSVSRETYQKILSQLERQYKTQISNAKFRIKDIQSKLKDNEL